MKGSIRVSAHAGPSHWIPPLRKIPKKSTLRPFVFDPLADSMTPVGWHYGLVPADWSAWRISADTRKAA